jgi:hypothetical protein
MMAVASTCNAGAIVAAISQIAPPAHWEHAVCTHRIRVIDRIFPPRREGRVAPGASESVTFPSGAKQGAQVWWIGGARFVVTLKPRTNGYAASSITAKLNDQAFLQLIVRRSASGVVWSTEGLVSGSRSGFVSSKRFALTYLNYPTYRAVRGGRGQVRVEVQELGRPLIASVRVGRITFIASRASPFPFTVTFRSHPSVVPGHTSRIGVSVRNATPFSISRVSISLGSTTSSLRVAGPKLEGLQLSPGAVETFDMAASASANTPSGPGGVIVSVSSGGRSVAKSLELRVVNPKKPLANPIDPTPRQREPLRAAAPTPSSIPWLPLSTGGTLGGASVVGIAMIIKRRRRSLST